MFKCKTLSNVSYNDSVAFNIKTFAETKEILLSELTIMEDLGEGQFGVSILCFIQFLPPAMQTFNL
jgi:hypothetical protein